MATLNYILEYHLVVRAAETGKIINKLLLEKLKNHPVVGDIRGKGMMWGVEFVRNKNSKEPFDPRFHFSQKVVDEAFNRGLILYPGSGCIDGTAGDHLMFAPPFIITENQIRECIEIILDSLEAVAGRG